jgi:hypothetical protein
MADFKELEEGKSFGGYTLERRVRHDGTGTFFAALTDAGERLLIKLVPKCGLEAEQQFAAWQRSRLLRHAHLLDVRDVGHIELESNSYIYSVFEYPDDILVSALEQGPLSEPETRSVLEAALAALCYLHGQGLVHGAVAPDHIVAVGETVKLATDALRESDDPEGYAEDVRQLGELVRSLRAPEPLREPLTAIVRHATARDARQRWTLAEIANVIEPLPAVTTAAPRPIRQGEADARSPGAFPKWILAGVAIFLLSILMFNVRRKPEATQVTPAAPALIEPVAPPPVNAPPPGPVIWRVIAFTYRSHDMAAKKAKQINNQWPDLRAAVFAPKGLRGYYLVALGDGMKREEAKWLQRKARSLGLPRDTYVQNYSE